MTSTSLAGDLEASLAELGAAAPAEPKRRSRPRLHGRGEGRNRERLNSG